MGCLVGVVVADILGNLVCMDPISVARGKLDLEQEELAQKGTVGPGAFSIEVPRHDSEECFPAIIPQGEKRQRGNQTPPELIRNMIRALLDDQNGDPAVHFQSRYPAQDSEDSFV
uniref:Uncharacterized protein n=1 Tax=Octactis speculum TaxID=3111310 RepID=A0A7S2BWM4_9STRA